MKKIDVEFQELPYAVEEAMNRLRINIKFCGKSTRKILITSSMPNEGKTSVAVNLWKMLAEAGFPTVLVDVDLRKSVIKDRHHMKGAGEICDLGYYLSGQSEMEDVIYETEVANAYMVPCVNILENPSALLEDSRFSELLDNLAERYRYVIIDSPPLDSVADGALVASLCDGAALVVRAGETSRGLIRQSMHQLEQSGCKLLGVILNRVETTGRVYKKYYGRYGKYYGGYGYGYGYGSYGREAAASEQNTKRTSKRDSKKSSKSTDKETAD